MEKGTKISMRENLVQLEKFWKIERKYSNQKRSFLLCQPWTDTGNYATMQII